LTGAIAPGSIRVTGRHGKRHHPFRPSRARIRPNPGPRDMRRCATATDALAFVREHGVVLASAKGAAPRLSEAIAGEAIKGSWWAHPQSHRIYAILAAVSESEQVLVCRLLDGKITLVHRSLWPALVRLSQRFVPTRIASVRDEHTPSGRHVSHKVPFPQWVPADVAEQAEAISEDDALAVFAAWLPAAGSSTARRAAASAPSN
jgi:hypothetical protein